MRQKQKHLRIDTVKTQSVCPKRAWLAGSSSSDGRSRPLAHAQFSGPALGI